MELSGRPSNSRVDETVAKVKELLNSDRRLSLKMIADEVSVNKFTVHQIIMQYLMMRKVCAKLVHRVLTAEQKQRRVDVCREMLNELENNPDFLDNEVTGDESCTFQYDPETKAQSSEWHTPASPRPKKARMSKSRVKTMLIVFFDKRGRLPRNQVSQFSGCKIADSSSRQIVSKWPAGRYLVSAFPLSDASDSPVIRLCKVDRIQHRVDRIRHRVDRMNKDEKEVQEQEIGEFPNNDHGPTTPPPLLDIIILQLATILEGLQPLHPRDLDLTAFDAFPLPSPAITSYAQRQQSPEVFNSSRNHPFQAHPTMQAHYVQPKDNDSFPFRHLSPDLFQEYQLPIKPASSHNLFYL
ncbi:hypothetical protein LAZ67_16002032 [Cordylochernes scorpioides]|uniref:Uncharacterized protein n=1 Tax=Cordylochernes scorpioides TaxID=51811 RepID=A0ABY6LGF4_9ARAC|nr:hypothetical protein LAZ67_16002032 [Cordylochernes scorpioides]